MNFGGSGHEAGLFSVVGSVSLSDRQLADTGGLTLGGTSPGFRNYRVNGRHRSALLGWGVCASEGCSGQGLQSAGPAMVLFQLGGEASVEQTSALNRRNSAADVRCSPPCWVK